MNRVSIQSHTTCAVTNTPLATSATNELKCYLFYGPADMPANRLVWLAGQQLFGLGDYESRCEQGWHRHATLVTLAHFFVECPNATACPWA